MLEDGRGGGMMQYHFYSLVNTSQCRRQRERNKLFINNREFQDEWVDEVPTMMLSKVKRRDGI